MTATAWMAALGTAGRVKTEARPVSFGPRIGDVLSVDCWDGQKWQSRQVEWNGERYVELECAA